MPYITGSAADMDAVKTALVNACKNDGWTEQTDSEGKTVLSKSGIYVRVEAGSDASGGTLELLGRTGVDSGDAPNIVSICTIFQSSSEETPDAVSFPVTYHAFTFSEEVFFVINYSDKYQWCAFGQSSQNGLPGTGNWVAASNSNTNEAGFTLSSSSGGGYRSGPGGYLSCGALFWQTSGHIDVANAFCHNDFDTDYPWALAKDGNYNDPVGIKYLTEILASQPNSFNGESVLMPIRAYKIRPESKVSQVLEVSNARHIKIDNYNDEQVITLGTDDWMVFPYFRRNIEGQTNTDTGTFGWAIKKES
jgi:hypothetical protein